MLLDGGDFAAAVSDAQKTKVSYLLRGMALLRYDAINLADKDLRYGMAYLKAMKSKYDLPFVSANIYRKDNGQLLAKPYLIKEIDGLKVGIFGITTTVATADVKEAFEIKDPVLTAKQIVAELRDEVDLVIALSHLGLENSRKLPTQVPGIDVVISGHRWNLSRQPERIGETLLMQPGAKGKYLGYLDCEVVDGKIRLIKGEAVSLSAQIKDDEELARLVAEYDRKELAPKSGGTH